MTTTNFKLFILPLIFLIAILVAGLFEQFSLDSKFAKYMNITQTLQQEVLAEKDCKDDILELEKMWQDSKKKLHIYIPHSDIADVEILIADVKGSIFMKEYGDAYVKLTVLHAKFRQIPLRYDTRVDNIF